MKDCEYFERLVSDRLDSAVSSEEAAELKVHLATCQSCSEFATGVIRQRELLRALPEIKMSVLEAATPLRWWQRRLVIPIPIAAALALIAISGWLIVFGSPDGKVEMVKNSSPVVRSIEIIRVEAVQAVQISDDNSDGKKDEVL